MALYIEGGDDAFRAILYGDHQQLQVPIVNSAFENIKPLFTKAAEAFNASVPEIFKAIDMSYMARVTRAAIRKVSSFWAKEGVHYLGSIGQFQNANIDMQRYVMAEPTVRALFHQQACDGYSETYVDLQPGKIGQEHYDYRRVTNSVHMPDYSCQGDVETYHRNAVTYTETLREGDRVLSTVDQAEIMASWNRLKSLILKRGEDPTSRYNSML